MDIPETTDPLPKPAYTVGLTFNLKKGIRSHVEDIEAEYDSPDTIAGIKAALEKAGCRVELLEADAGLLEKLLSTKVDIVFNIAEGIYGRGREAQVPAILNFLKIPYTGSDETTLCIALDKGLTKRLLSTYRVKTPAYQVISSPDARIKNKLKYPLIVKPNAEGSSKGISDLAVAGSKEELRKVLVYNIRAYNQPMLVEEYIPGREFTVGIVGNGEETVVFPPMEICYKKKDVKNLIYSYNVKRNYTEYIEYLCPAPLDKNTEIRLVDVARNIYNILLCRDFSRIDFRMSEDGDLYFIEINPLPGLAPGYSDYPMIAGFNGIGYDQLIVMILNSALKRYGMAPVNATALVI